MARTITEIVNAIFTDKNSRSQLDGLNSTSKTAVYRNWVYNAAFAQNSLEEIQDRFEAQVNELIANNIGVGGLRWYSERAREFQLGYQLTLDGTRYSYAVDDPESRIIAAVSVTEDSGGTLSIKIAKENATSGELEALSSQEKGQFTAYISRIKVAGTKINVISLASDQLVMSGCTIYYDAIYAEATIKTAVEDALTTYTKNIPFDAMVKASTVVDVIQAVEGVSDVVMNALSIKSGPDITPVGRVVLLPAGYINQADSPYSFDDLITYIAV